MAEKLIKIGKFAEKLNCTKRTISHYIQEGVLIPEQLPRRPGMVNRFGERNLYEMLLIQELVRNGYGLKPIKKILNGPFGKTNVSANGNEIMVIYDGHRDNRGVLFTESSEDGYYQVRMKDWRSATVIDLSGLRNKAKQLAIRN